MGHSLIALEKGLETAHLKLNGEFDNDQAINLDLVVSVQRTSTNCFLRDTDVGQGSPYSNGLDNQVDIFILHFTLVGNVHRRWVFFADTRITRDAIFQQILSQAYSAKNGV